MYRANLYDKYLKMYPVVVHACSRVSEYDMFIIIIQIHMDIDLMFFIYIYII